jgi:hypothetical protein
MNLNLQLARGGFALAVLALSAATAWLAPPAASSAEATRRVVLVADGGDVVIAACPLPTPVLRLASAPGDLPGRLTATGCRA